jgi:hypothetical protein
MFKPLALILIIPLAACDLSALEGKPSKFQIYRERIAALETQVAGMQVPAVSEAVFFVEPEAVCVPVFRVVEC